MTPVSLRNLPLPEPHLAVLATGILLQAVHPLRLPGRRLADLCAGLLLGAAATTIGWATREAGTVDLAEPDRLITSGPYAVARHPMYEAWTGMYGAAALGLRNGWLAMLLPVLLALVHRETGREEGRLRERFGAAHATYVSSVPRYLPVRLAWMFRAHKNAPKEQGRSTAEAEASAAVRIQ